MAAITGKSFQSYDEGVKYVEQFARNGCHPLKHCSRSTVAQYNRKIRADDKKISDLPGDAVYSVRWTCKHFGTFRARVGDKAAAEGTAKQRSRTHYSRGCKFFIYLSWSKAEQAYIIKNCDTEHSHDIGPELYNMYADNRYV